MKSVDPFDVIPDDEYKRRLTDTVFTLSSDYIVYDEDGNIVKVTCRNCGITISEYVNGPTYEEDGRIIIKMVFKRLSPYRNVTMLLDNESRLSCPMCSRCAAALRSADLDELLGTTILALARQAAILNKQDEFATFYTDALSGRTVVRRVS
jgi:hypothetical protein